MKSLVVLFLGFCMFGSLFAQKQRALVIGIDAYEVPDGVKVSEESGRIEFPDLQGCKNDAMSIKALITTKFGFNESNVAELYDRDATRKGILDKIDNLLKESNKGDIAFIYYAGHGSQVRNSKSKESDKKDESIVPSNTWQSGVSDITDKELATRFNKFLDKGVKLTIIFDCCHSGSISRGPVFDKPRYRYMPESNFDTKDASNPVAPEKREDGDFLIFSAAQDNEFAQEQIDENDIPHGAFTIALMQAINQLSVDASAQNIFTSTRAILKSNGKKQEPVLGGKAERKGQTLFGIGKGVLPDKMLIPVLSVKDNRVEMQAGYAQSVNKDNELTLYNKNATGAKDTIVIKVDSVLSITKSWASVIKGNISSVKPGQLFEVTNWVSSKAPLLKLYIPPSAYNSGDIKKMVAANIQLRQSSKVKWINNLEQEDPALTVFFNNGKCYVNNGKIAELKDYSSAEILKLAKSNSNLYFNLPASKKVSDAVQERLKQNRNITIVNNPNDAQYILYGTLDENNRPAYGLMRTQVESRDSLEAMPVQTKAFSINDENDVATANVSDSIYEYAMRLSKVRGWLNLAGPRGGTPFPFHLELKNSNTGKAADEAKVGDEVSLHVVADKNYKSVSISQKYIYAFGIDKKGKMQLLYPDDNGGNVENKFPKKDGDKIVEDLELVAFSIGEPVGTDTYILIASDEPIQNYSMVFNQEGVRGVDTRGSKNPISDLLNLGNEGTRGFGKSPANWNLLKLSVKSKH